MRYWINTISRDHVLLGVEGGFTQADYGRATRLAKIEKGDFIVFYSPRTEFRTGEPLQAFTAIGRITDDVPYQVQMRPGFHPWRRQVKFSKSREIPIAPLVPHLEFIADKRYWGYPFRQGLFEVNARISKRSHSRCASSFQSMSRLASTPGQAATRFGKGVRRANSQPTGVPRARRSTGGNSMVAGPQRRAASQTRLILLGTGGGPRPRKANSAPAQVVVANETAYVIDCGNGVARQLAFSGVPLAKLRHVFITHHHSDHNADYGNLIWLAWAAGLRTLVDTWGPPPLEKMTRLFFEMNACDIDTRIADEGRVPLVPLVYVHELSRGGPVMRDENVKVTAALVHHPPVVPAFAYRFDAADRSIVISGDTAPSDNLIELAQGADVLVHDAFYVPGVDRLVARVPNAATLKQSILSHHTNAEDAGRVAQAAGVKLLVLSHLVPPDDPAITDQMGMDAARVHFRGAVIAGKDLLEI